MALVAVTAIGPLAMQIFLPALPIIQQGFGVTPAIAQLALTISMVSIAIATLVYGPISDRFGRRPVLIVGLVLFIVGSLVCLLAPNIETLIVGRILQAAGGTSGLVLARAIVRDVYAHEKVASVLAYLTIAMVIPPMLAPVVGGLLTDWIGWRAIFGFVGIAGVLVLAITLRGLTETNLNLTRHSSIAGIAEDFVLLLRSPAFCGYAFAGAFSLAAFFIFASSAPYLMVKVMGRSVTEYGLYFVTISLSFMAGNYVAARLSEPLGINRMILVGSIVALIAVAGAALLAAQQVWTPLALFAPMTLIVFGNGIAAANLQAGALGIYPQRAGTASGLSGFLQMLVASIFAQAAGVLTENTPIPMVSLMFLALTLALAAFGVAHRHTKIQPQAQVP